VGEERQEHGRHRPLFELATTQHGVISTRQLDRLGYSPSSASKANRVGRLRRIYRGVYAVGHEPLTWEGRCMAAVLAARPAVASHLAAAYLLELVRFRPETIHVTAPSARRSPRDFRIHDAALHAADITVVDAIPVTTLPRTLLDLAAVLSEERLMKALERAEELKIFDLGPVEELLARTGGHLGAGRLRRALAIYRPEPTVLRSRLERRFLDLIRKAGLPEPAMNHVVAGFELDSYWERERFVVELDVFETHGTHVAFERDRERQDDLLAIGIEMIRVTGPRLKREPQEVMRRIAEHLERRRGELAR
jgi:very-short-patch-repair endonuclease